MKDCVSSSSRMLSEKFLSFSRIIPFRVAFPLGTRSSTGIYVPFLCPYLVLQQRFQSLCKANQDSVSLFVANSDGALILRLRADNARHIARLLILHLRERSFATSRRRFDLMGMVRFSLRYG